MEEDYLEREKRKMIEQFTTQTKKQAYFDWLIKEIEKEKREASNILKFKKK